MTRRPRKVRPLCSNFSSKTCRLLVPLIRSPPDLLAVWGAPRKPLVDQGRRPNRQRIRGSPPGGQKKKGRAEKEGSRRSKRESRSAQGAQRSPHGAEREERRDEKRRGGEARREEPPP